MICINVRSPFVVSIGDYGATQTGSRVKLSIYQKGVTPPTSGVGYYSRSKNVPSATQRETRYNISNYVKEFFQHTYQSSIGSTPTNAPVEDWIFVDVELAWYNGTTYTVISNTTYVGLDGYNNYMYGANQVYETDKMYLLLNDAITRNVKKSSDKSFNLLVQALNAGEKADVVYTTTYLGSPYTVTRPIVTSSDARSIYNKKIALSLENSFPAQFNENNITLIDLKWFAGVILRMNIPFYIQIIAECKYTPVQCTFINRYGGWETLAFFKAQSNSISVKNTEYKLTQTDLNYNSYIGQFKTFNTNGRQKIKLNTGFVDENYSEIISDLLLAETILLDDVPVTVKTTSTEFKNTLKDKNINYEIEFEYAFNLINDVI
jgi:hypothetical protein